MLSLLCIPAPCWGYLEFIWEPLEGKKCSKFRLFMVHSCKYPCAHLCLAPRKALLVTRPSRRRTRESMTFIGHIVSGRSRMVLLRCSRYQGEILIPCLLFLSATFCHNYSNDVSRDDRPFFAYILPPPAISFTLIKIRRFLFHRPRDDLFPCL